jgi:hypothetical protein
MERVLYGIGVAVANIIYFTFVGIFRLVTFGIFKYKQANPTQIALHEELRFEHTLITSGSGWGKTQLLQQMILQDLPEVKRGYRSVVVMDSQGDMIRKITRLKELAPVKAPPPPPPPATTPTAETAQTSQERKAHTPLKYVLLSAQVLAYHVLVYMAMLYAARTAFNMGGNGTDIQTAAYATPIIIGVITGLCIYRRVKVLEIVIGSLIFAAGYLFWWRSIYSYSYYLAIALPIFAGLGIRKLFDFSDEPQTVPQSQEAERRHSLAERVVIIDPSDIEHPPALNLFDFGLDRAKGYSALERRAWSTARLLCMSLCSARC